MTPQPLPRGSAACLALALLVACGTETPTSVAPDVAFAIEDAVHNNGNEHFYWLPPMVSNPSWSGDFDATQSPEVEICELSGSTCVTPFVAVYTMTSGPGGEVVTVEPTDEHYHVNWHTDEFNLDPAKTYRIATKAQGQELGYADVDVVSNGSQLKNVDTNEFIALKDGRTLPIKFRIEDGAIVSDPCAAINFPDPNLEAYIRWATGIATGPISEADVQGVHTVDFFFAPGPIQSIEGLECFSATTTMSLRTNGQVTDLSPIAGLTQLTGLSIINNPVTDLTPLSGLTNLTFLNIASTPASDLSPIAPLTNLTSLFMHQMPNVTDVTALSGMTQLQSLWIIGSPLNGPVSALASLTAMSSLVLSNSGVTDLNFASGMTQLGDISIGGNQISDLSPLVGKPLTYISAPANQLSDLTPLGSITSLTALILFNNTGITDISPIGNLTGLTSIHMAGHNIDAQRSVLANLTQLRNLRLNNMGITDIAFASGMTLIESFDVDSNSISDATPLIGHPNLTLAYLPRNVITCGHPSIVQLEADGVDTWANFATGGFGQC